MASDFPAAFAALRDVLRKHAGDLIVVVDTATDFTVSSPAIGPKGKPMWFGCVKLGKSAVSYHLMPLYFNPELQATVTPELARRQQGKTCFNFQRPDPVLFAQLDELTRRGREQWQRHGMLDAGPLDPARLAAALRAGGADLQAIAKERKVKGKAAAAKRAETISRKKTVKAQG
jgi:hypothetical protein